MRYLKSVLFVVLVSILAVQANANVFTSALPLQEELAPSNVIEEIYEGRSAQIKNMSPNNIFVSLVYENGNVVILTDLGSNEIASATDLSPGVYTLSVTHSSGNITKKIVIE